MYRRRSLKPMIITMSALMIVTLIGIAYSVFTGQLNITGSAANRSSSWDIHFENLSNITTTHTAKVLSEPTLDGTTTIEDYSVSTTTPGDSISFTFDVRNSGNYNAKITSVTIGTPTCTGTDTTSNTNVCSHLSYTLTYASGASIQTDDIIYAKDYVTMKVTLTYSDTVLASELATSDVSISNLGITINFEQSGDALVKDNGEVANYRVYHQGEKVTINNEDYYIIADSGAGQDYVTALKGIPLTSSEVSTYGDGLSLSTREYQGYVGVAFGSSNVYDSSSVKALIDNWSLGKFQNNELKEINEYKARLITITEYNAISSTHTWRYNSKYYYWTMSTYSSWVLYVGINANTNDYNPNSNFYSYSLTVRPVINVYKSALETNNNE